MPGGGELHEKHKPSSSGLPLTVGNVFKQKKKSHQPSAYVNKENQHNYISVNGMFSQKRKSMNDARRFDGPGSAGLTSS